MKKLIMVYVMLISLFMLYVTSYQLTSSKYDSLSQMNNCTKGDISEKYVMVSFQSGIEYWKNALKGFEDAAQVLNVSVEYYGATNRDVNEQVTVLEQVIAKKPAGIALSAIDPDALHAVIDKAYLAGIPIVLFDSGSPKSKALSFLGTNNYQAGVIAAHEMAVLIQQSGQVAVVSMPNQLNMAQRYAGFKDTIALHYPQIQMVIFEDGKGDHFEAQLATNRIFDQYPHIKGIFVTEAVAGAGVGHAVKRLDKLSQTKIISFDTDRDTLDLVKDGTITITLAQGTWNMGYWSLQYLYHLQHDPAQLGQTWNQQKKSPIVPVNLDTGISVVTRDNVLDYYPH